MASLVLQLQQKALDSSTTLSDVLRTALVTAKKLHLSEFEAWIQNELNGYRTADEVPDYRTVGCQVIATDEFGRKLPVMFQDPDEERVASRRILYAPISSLEILPSESAGSLSLPLPNSIRERLHSAGPVYSRFPVSEARRVVDTVRNRLLEWALRLEEDGILGEGLVFTEQERSKASGGAINIGEFRGVLGNVTGTNVQIGDYSSLISRLENSICLCL
jgi:hypothetical protein